MLIYGGEDDVLQPFLPFSSRLVAIDYIVCDESDSLSVATMGTCQKALCKVFYLAHKYFI